MSDDWKPWGDLDEADAQLGSAKRHTRDVDAPGDADAQDAYEDLQHVIDHCRDAQRALE